MIFGKVTCNACDALFRPCSFAKVNDNPDSEANISGFVDTLHVVSEDACQDKGELTGLKPLKSKGGTITPARSDDGSKKPATRFSRAAVKVMREWFEAHAERPYPTDEEKLVLARETGLKQSQITTWLANYRRRSKVGRTAPKACASPSLRPTTPAVAIPGASNVAAWQDLNPFERWQHSPPDHDPAAIQDIAKAVASSDLPTYEDSSSPSTTGYKRHGSSNESGFSAVRAPSTTSFETGLSNSRSATSSSAVWSHASHDSFGSFGSFGSGLNGKKDRRRRRRGTQPLMRKTSDDTKKRMFQCTFCTDTFKSKYDWTRHEKSLHLSLEKWICSPLGPVMTDPATGIQKCAYCNEINPSKAHFETHNHDQCEQKGIESRTFFRKDHLRQHLRLMHGCELIPAMDAWKTAATSIRCRCGFCGQRFTSWQERVDHLAAHFKDGAKMMDWKGCRGFDPEVAAHVTNAMPPYLIGMESTSPEPFSATNPATWDNQIMSGEGYPDLPANLDCAGMATAPGTDVAKEGLNAIIKMYKYNVPGAAATCWEVLTVRLGMFAKSQADQGIVVTDEMLQRQARLIVYDSDDSWNQTAADNPEWLELFKQACGLGWIPSTIGGTGLEVPEDLEFYGDLGIRIPFSVQLAYSGSGNHLSLGTSSTPASSKRPSAAEESDVMDPVPPYQRYHEAMPPQEKAAQFESTAGPSLLSTANYGWSSLPTSTSALGSGSASVPVSSALSAADFQIMAAPVASALDPMSLITPTQFPVDGGSFSNFGTEIPAQMDVAMEDFDFDSINFDDYLHS